MSTPFQVPHRALLHVSGEDARDFLDRILTLRIADVTPARPGYGALLTPQGKIIAELFVFATADGSFILDVHAGSLEPLVKRLTLMRLRAKVSLSEVEGAGVLQRFAPDPDKPADPRSDAAGARWVGVPDAGNGDAAAYHAERIARGLPEQGADYATESVFPADVGLDLLGGVDYAKGCFVGQEVVSRMKRRGTIRKRPLIAHYEGEAPEPGRPITAGVATVGETLSRAGTTGLALVRLDRLAAAEEAGAATVVEGVPVTLTHPTWLPESQGASAPVQS